MYSFIDLFSGIGGFRLGLENVGMNCLFSCEIDSYARKTYQKNFKDKPYEDIYDLDEDTLSKYGGIDIIAAGFPCQPFSISGKQKGFEDLERGNLFFEIIRLTKIIQPKVLLLENVAHLINHDKGNTFNVIIKTLEKLDYKVYYQILDASDYGLPQHRKRIYIVAFNKKVPFIFNKGELKKQSIESVIDNSFEHTYLDDSEYTLIEKPNVSPNGMKFVGYLNKNIRKRGADREKLHLSRTHRQVNRIYSFKHLHPTITSSESSGRYFILDNKGVRKLTLLECFRLQGFPDTFKKPVSITQLYKQIGNSVPIPVIESIGNSIKVVLDRYYKTDNY